MIFSPSYWHQLLLYVSFSLYGIPCRHRLQFLAHKSAMVFTRPPRRSNSPSLVLSWGISSMRNGINQMASWNDSIAVSFFDHWLRCCNRCCSDSPQPTQAWRLPTFIRLPLLFNHFPGSTKHGLAYASLSAFHSPFFSLHRFLVPKSPKPIIGQCQFFS